MDIIYGIFKSKIIHFSAISDVTKLLGEKFEYLGIVRDESSKNKSYENYFLQMTEI